MDVDVAIIGAGPAGCAAAITCAGQGLRVALYDGPAPARPRPGETLHPGAEPVFQALGVVGRVRAADFLRHAGTRSRWGGPEVFHAFGTSPGPSGPEPWLGFQAWRPTLDAILLARAAEVGVALFRPCRARAPLVDAGRVVGISTDAGEVTAKVVIDAAGGRHWLARRLALPIRRDSPPLRVRYGHAFGRSPQLDAAPVIEGAPWGWAWAARVRADVYAWATLTRDGRPPPGGWVPEPLRPLDPEGAPRGADVTWRLAPASGPGFLSVGDAASVVDPAASHGVLKALLTGVWAAGAAAGGIRDPGRRVGLACRYAARVAAWFNRDVAALRAFYGRLPPG
ncbi:MAG TPA: FAD-dependent monooxygenase [Tepidisphaeraceae bacterium]|nr:FAD-dependent monooxygenase [Tepidisphaeraceae bacterium]